MADYTFFGYAAAAVPFDTQTGSFTLDANYDWRDDRFRMELSDDDAYFDGDVSNNEIGEDSNQTATIYDGAGNIVASGKVYVEQYAEIQNASGDWLYLDRIEINGQHIGYMSSTPMTPGVAYSYSYGEEVDDNYFTGSSTVDNRETYNNYFNVPCFGAGTLIQTPHGDIPIEWLEVGEEVVTRDHGPREIAWKGWSRVSAQQMTATPALRPFQLRQDPLTGARVRPALILSAQHRVLICDNRARTGFIAVKHLQSWHGVARLRPVTTFYHHICLHDHQVIKANGVWCESLLARGTQAPEWVQPPDYARPTAWPQQAHIRPARPLLRRKDVGRVRLPRKACEKVS